MAKLITVYWRDIPSQIIAKRGRDTVKLRLSQRFQTAIHRAAMRAGKGGSELYLEEWRRESKTCDKHLEERAREEIDTLEAHYSGELLDQLVKDKGYKVKRESLES